LGRGRRYCRSHQLEEDGGVREMKTRSVLGGCQHSLTSSILFKPRTQLFVLSDNTQ
jgi:hypothetical protein